MHTQQRNWVSRLKAQLPEYFYFKDVLEIGAVNINGTAREFFESCDYTGLDVAPGPGVDIVAVAHQFKTERRFDVVFSTSALEHDMYWRETLHKMVELTKPNGLMFFSCGAKWEEHGTLTHNPSNSLTISQGKKWGNYYKNLQPQNIFQTLLVMELFTDWSIGIDSNMDLVFWGIKK